METKNVYIKLLKDAAYALDACSRDLVCEAYGAAKLAYGLKMITWEQFRTLNTMLIVNGINNRRNLPLF